MPSKLAALTLTVRAMRPRAALTGSMVAGRFGWRLSDRRLYGLRDAGQILALGGGVYRWADAPPADDDLVEIAERVPRATLCLETALARHGLIDAIPAAIDIAVPRGSTRPALRAPCRLHQFDARTFDLERELLDVGARRPLGLYTAERSIIDAIRLRHRGRQRSGVAGSAALAEPVRGEPGPAHRAGPVVPARRARSAPGSGGAAVTAPSRATIAGQAYLDLRRKARQDRRPVDELIQLYVLESFLARLAQTPFAERFVLKGGMLLAALRGAPPHPATSTYRPAPRAAAPALCSPQCVRSPPLPSRTEWCSIWTQPPQGKFATRTSTQGSG